MRSRLLSAALAATLVVPGCGGTDQPAPPPPATPPPAAATPEPLEPVGAQPDAPPALPDADVPPETAPPATRPPAPPRPQARTQPPPRRPAPRTPPRTAPPAQEQDPDPDAYERDLAREQQGRERREREEREARAVTLPEGTRLRFALNTAVSSATSREGDKIEARLQGATGENGEISLPKGAILRGHVEEAVGSGRVKGRARLVLVFDEIVVDGRVTPIRSIVIEKEAASDVKRDAAIAGGAAAAGAVIGGILGGKDGARKGAVIGGAAGGGAVLATKGSEVELPAGSEQSARIRERIRID